MFYVRLKRNFWIFLGAGKRVEVLPWLRHLDVGLLPRRAWFDIGPLHVRSVVEELEVGTEFSEYFDFALSESFHQCSAPNRLFRSVVLQEGQAMEAG
jgi:hypothetical protein